MKARACTVLVGTATTIAVMALMPKRSHAQPGGDGGGVPPGGDSGDAATVDCAMDGSSAHYDEFLQ